MKRFLMALVVLAIASAPALAGPNAGGVIVVGNTGMLWTSDPLPPTPVPDCSTMVNEAPLGGAPGNNLIWKVYAAFPTNAQPRLKTCGWGIGYPSVNGGGITIEHNDAQNLAVFYITSAGWPASLTEVGMSFTDGARTAIVNELWWFSGYAYEGAGGEGQTFCVIPNSAVGNQVFGDDAFPTNEDPIAGYGCLGFGTPGFTPCPPDVPVAGACCFPTSADCVMLLPAECAAAGGSFYGGDCTPQTCPPPPVFGACCVGEVCNVVTPAICANLAGTYYGDGSVCVPNPCPIIPVETRSWGQIKGNYR